jgi:adenylate cyclase
MLPTPTTTPVGVEVLVAFADLSSFARLARTMSSSQTFEFIAEFAQRTGTLVQASGGTIVKYVGDSALIVWPAELADDAMQALFGLKADVDLWLSKAGHSSQLVIKAHLGEVAWGLLGAPGDLRPDVIGETVNIAALLTSPGLAVTPQAFRALSPELRQRLKKHTPPVTYLPLESRRP